MNDERLDAIWARCEHGVVNMYDRWVIVPARSGDSDMRDIVGANDDEITEDGGFIEGYDPYPVVQQVFESEAKFIAHARTDVPDMLAEIVRLRKAMDRALAAEDADMYQIIRDAIHPPA